MKKFILRRPLSFAIPALVFFLFPFVSDALIGPIGGLTFTCAINNTTQFLPCNDGNSNTFHDKCTTSGGMYYNICIGTPNICGDGHVFNQETCDDGNTVSGDGCNSTCLVEAGYSCTGDVNTPSTCSTVCGDGIISANEACDDGDTNSGDGCSATCQPEDGYVCTGAPSVCTSTATCGDGTKEAPEACDDGNTTAGDGCSATCAAEGGYDCSGASCITICGDGVKTGAEKCDDQNTTAGDGCDVDCAKVEDGYTCSETNGLSACTQSGTPPSAPPPEQADPNDVAGPQSPDDLDTQSPDSDNVPVFPVDLSNGASGGCNLTAGPISSSLSLFGYSLTGLLFIGIARLRKKV